MATIPARRLQSQITHNKILKTRTKQTNLSKRQTFLSEQNEDDDIDFDRRSYNRLALPCCLWCQWRS